MELLNVTICFRNVLSILCFTLPASLVWAVPASLFLCPCQSHHKSGDKCGLPWLSYSLLPLDLPQYPLESYLLCSRKGFQKLLMKSRILLFLFYFRSCDRSFWIISAFFANYQIAAKKQYNVFMFGGMSLGLLVFKNVKILFLSWHTGRWLWEEGSHVWELYMNRKFSGGCAETFRKGS